MPTTKINKRDAKLWYDNPRVKVTHYGGDKKNSLGQKTGRILQTNKSSDVLFMNWQKDVSAPTGHLTMSLVPRQDYLTGKNRIRPNDFLIAEADAGDGSGMTVIAYLLVDRITLTSTTDAKGAQHEVVQVACSDFGKVLEETSLIVDPGIRAFGTPGIRAMGLSVEAINTVLKHSKNNASAPNQVVFDLFQLVLQSSDAQFVIPNTETTFSDLVSYEFIQNTMIGAGIVSTALIGMDANVKLWGLLKQYSNEAFNELFVDVRYEDPFQGNDGVTDAGTKLAKSINNSLGGASTPLDTDGAQPAEQLQDSDGRDAPLYLIHRARPYDFDTFKGLTEATVFRSEVTHLDVGVASHEAFNVFRVFGIISGGLLPAENQLVRTNPASIRRNGPKRFEPETLYLFPNVDAASDQNVGKSQADFTKMLKMYTNIISIWNASNDSLFAGTVTLRFRPDIRVGQRFVLRDDTNTTLEAYIQALTHNISAEPQKQSTTTLTIVRGLIRNNDSSTTSNLTTDLVIDPNASDEDVRLKFGFKDDDSLGTPGLPAGAGDFTDGGSGNA